jgi:uncharacterized protein
MDDAALPCGDLLVEIIKTKMPFGKYKDKPLKELPVAYLEWFARKGFPKSKLGQMLATLLEIKLNGLEHLLTELERQIGKS